MTTLDLHYQTIYAGAAFTVHEIQPLVRSSPHLRQLSIDSCPDEVYDEVAQHCPNIQQLVINVSDLGFMTINDESYGLKTLALGYVRSGAALESLLTRHASSLETLHLFQVLLDITGTFDIFSTVKFTNLVNIIMCGVVPEISQQLPRMVHETSQLKALSLGDVDGIVPDSVFETLVVRFPNFRHLTLHSCDFNDAALSRCLHSFATGSARSSSLENLDIYPRKGYTNNTVLKTCARITSLKRLSIYHHQRSPTAVESFAKEIAKLPRLEKLNIYNLPMTEKDIQVIGENSSIRNVYLAFSEGITREQARSALIPGVFVHFGDTFDYSDSDYIENENTYDDFYWNT